MEFGHPNAKVWESRGVAQGPPWVADRAPEVFFETPYPRFWLQGRGPPLLPHMCLLLQSGPLPSPHISFPLASCLGPGQRSVGGGLCPRALLVLAPSIPTGDIEARPDPEPLKSSWV